MKYLFYLLPFILLSCSSGKQNQSTVCPSEGTCSVSLQADQSLSIKKDGIGKLYPVITTGNQILFKYQYSKNTPENTSDGQYTETIYAIFPKEINNITLKNEQLQSISLAIEHSCFCKELSGLKPINEGRISVKKTDKDTYNIQLEITQADLNNKIKTINETVILK